jgi:hypothetical protein
MQIADFSLLVRKIAVGIGVTLVPLLIIAGGLWVTQKLLAH